MKFTDEFAESFENFPQILHALNTCYRRTCAIEKQFNKIIPEADMTPKINFNSQKSNAAI